MVEAFIYDHVRTPRGRGRPDGALHEVTAVQLATQVLKALSDRSSLDTCFIDDVVMGCAQPVGEQGGNIARAAVLTAGYDQGVAAQQVHRFCASALEAVNNAAAQVMVGASDAAIGAGVESLSRTFMGADSGAWAADPAVAYNTYFAPQGIGADLIATLDGFSREDVDSYAVESQKRAAAAWREGRFKNAIVPVRDVLGDVLLDHDEHMRPGTTLEQLGALKPSFTFLGEQAGFDLVGIQKYPQIETVSHVHTGGNSSGIVDGAAGVLVGNVGFGKKTGLKPRARIRAFTSIGSEPTIMLTAPADVTNKCLARASMTKDDIDLFEVNEAFASVVLRFMKLLEIDHAKVNVNGGAIAMGHPLGATGAMLVGTVLDELERRSLGTALITLCAGNGLGTATIIERI
ncbi:MULTISPECIES: acetyl-CoA C-acetyltransferase [unclassified Chelatococcus]|uniref:acetyl-CoA C-acetyltransferase n=1 Tax=unclassified Chelatococcus TaxID=2638111 RepID=UPI001BCE0A6A|nr:MULTISPECIES: acetyl-CoA C-acetyltransferase [unclassified Chelatococcus]MBS7743462.1 acetyl-CoA C-acetyltransferase [Chelatococcus sp. HY11]MBX3547098.1 acetyl-CoA C-acetyltransferase [Chelatococcus sp.]CAH1663663.1 3-ketoacyl-CoA thiolase [Hyphomicrobiales bacterium]CAH1687818.1 3-ketoacyl-CoA thiolase [Hyphomicrobiales bacterium]